MTTEPADYPILHAADAGGTHPGSGLALREAFAAQC